MPSSAYETVFETTRPQCFTGAFHCSKSLNIIQVAIYILVGESGEATRNDVSRAAAIKSRRKMRVESLPPYEDVRNVKKLALAIGAELRNMKILRAQQASIRITRVVTCATLVVKARARSINSSKAPQQSSQGGGGYLN